MTKDKNEIAENLHERMRQGRAAAQERRRERRDGELDRLAKLRDEAKGPLRDWLTARLERRREELKRATKRRADREAKRAARDARHRARREARDKPRTTVLEAMDARELELAGE